ncbi:hypothetical protein BH20ACI4_BH20ACI4_23910 [soil metagenome]
MFAVFLMQTLFFQQTFAETKEEKFAQKVKTEIAKLGTGTDAKIKIKLKDGTKIKGYVLETNDSEFVVMNAKTNQAIPVAYPQVSQAKGNNLSKGTIIIIGFVGLIVLLVVLLSSST